jgi:hypothetical protein
VPLGEKNDRHPTALDIFPSVIRRMDLRDGASLPRLRFFLCRPLRIFSDSDDVPKM